MIEEATSVRPRSSAASHYRLDVYGFYVQIRQLAFDFEEAPLVSEPIQ